MSALFSDVPRTLGSPLDPSRASAFNELEILQTSFQAPPSKPTSSTHNRARPLATDHGEQAPHFRHPSRLPLHHVSPPSPLPHPPAPTPSLTLHTAPPPLRNDPHVHHGRPRRGRHRVLRRDPHARPRRPLRRRSRAQRRRPLHHHPRRRS